MNLRKKIKTLLGLVETHQRVRLQSLKPTICMYIFLPLTSDTLRGMGHIQVMTAIFFFFFFAQSQI